VTEKSQIDRFKEAARQLEADENEAAFDEKLKAVAGHKIAGGSNDKAPPKKTP